MKLLRILLRASVLAVLAGLLGAGIAVAQSDQGLSLGELARKKKKEKDDKKTTHVYSDENLPKAGADFGGRSTVGASGAPAAASSASSAAPAGEGAAAPAAGGEGEPAPAGEPSPDLEAAKQKVETAKQDEATAQKNIQKLEEQMASETSDFRRETYRQALENAQTSLVDFKRKREEAEKEEAAAEAAGKKKKKKKPATTEEAPQ